MPDPHNLNCMFKVSRLAMLSTPLNNEEFCLEVEKGFIQDKQNSTEDLIRLNIQGASDQFMVNLCTQPQLKPSSPRNPPVFGGFINEDTDTESDSSKDCSDIKVVNTKAYDLETFLSDAGVNQDDQHTQKVLTDAGFNDWTEFLLADHTSMVDLTSLDLEPGTTQKLVFQA
ncbi:hypothetical protein CROQUDRAFT_89340 [Cronartium quercuum f. sp. fusiforme G11]|uniref:Uncharacterized protein n=1 Tax=Cronartium quercuum f. sp. fusiforme G11 TaxID=708437 RepID=A0A9P6NPF7_9BASI|nr:hypothetical protein CROQUDRAFT_89340 [Cronartium quercuum f. sp. fusiforme G11]